MKAFSLKGPATKGFFGPNALTLGNPFPSPPASTNKTWTTLITGFENGANFYRALDFVNGTFIISTNNGNQHNHTVIFSTNGTIWTENSVVTTGTSFRSEGIGFGGGNYAYLIDAGGSAPRIYTSPDLTTWTQQNTGFAVGSLLTRPVFGNGVFLLTKLGAADYATSPDGVTWTHHANYVPTAWEFRPIFDGTQFVAPVRGIGGLSKVAVSNDGINWTESAVTLGGIPQAVGNNASTQYVVGRTSTDSGDSLNGALTVDTPISFNDGGNPSQAITFGGGSWARCNGNIATLQSSSSGIIWVQDTVSASATFFQDIAFGLGEFIAIGGQTGNHQYTAFRAP